MPPKTLVEYEDLALPMYVLLGPSICFNYLFVISRHPRLGNHMGARFQSTYVFKYQEILEYFNASEAEERYIALFYAVFRFSSTYCFV